MRANQTAFAVWITGLPASGKSTLAAELARQVRDLGTQVTVLESDAMRKLFSDQPRYDEQDREFFYTSLAFIGRILTEHGVSVIFDATANLRAYRDLARQQIPRFLEVYVQCPLEICILRDPKGIYRQAREGTASQVPGIQAIYEPPQEPDIIFHGDHDDATDAARRIIDLLGSKGFLRGGEP